MSKYTSAPAISISAEEVEQLSAPFVIEVAGEQFALKGVNSLSLDDFGMIIDTADSDVTKLPPLLAYDEPSEGFLRSCGAGVLKEIFLHWMESQKVSLGESSSSGS